jgi:glycosyltransferase involved in cell wall biosynthesis
METKDTELIVVGTDRLLFEEGSAVRERQVVYAREWKQVSIIVFSVKKYTITKISENCTVYPTNSFTKLGYMLDAIRIGKNIIKKISKVQPIMVSCQDPFETGIVGRILQRQRVGIKLLLQIHTDMYSPYFTDMVIGFKSALLNRIRKLISIYTLPHAQTVRVVSDKIANSLIKRGVDARKIIVHPIKVPTPDIQRMSPLFDLRGKYPQFKKIMLVVSRLEPEKNVEMAIRAMKIVTSTYPSTGMIIVGSGGLKIKLQKLVTRLSLEENVLFEGWKTDLLPYYKGSDALLVTSWFEGYGMVFKEAQAVGCAIVSTDVGIAREVGAYIIDWNVKSVSEAILKILN